MKTNDCPASCTGHMIIKYLLIMKLAAIIIFITSFQAFAINGVSQKRINLDLKNVTIPAILERIEAKYDYRFFYNEELSLEKVRLDLYTRNATIDYVMERLLINTSFSYKKVNNSLVVIIGDPKIKAELPIKGKIVDKNGTPLARVSIVEKGTLNGAVTNCRLPIFSTRLK